MTRKRTSRRCPRSRTSRRRRRRGRASEGLQLVVRVAQVAAVRAAVQARAAATTLQLNGDPGAKNKNKKHVTAAQVLLRWAAQHGLAVVPKSSDANRQRDNAALWGDHLRLLPTEMAQLDRLSQQQPKQNTMIGWLREYDPDHY